MEKKMSRQAMDASGTPKAAPSRVSCRAKCSRANMTALPKRERPIMRGT